MRCIKQVLTLETFFVCRVPVTHHDVTVILIIFRVIIPFVIVFLFVILLLFPLKSWSSSLLSSSSVPISPCSWPFPCFSPLFNCHLDHLLCHHTFCHYVIVCVIIIIFDIVILMSFLLKSTAWLLSSPSLTLRSSLDHLFCHHPLIQCQCFLWHCYLFYCFRNHNHLNFQCF